MKNEIMTKVSQALFYMNQVHIEKGRENADNMSTAFKCLENLVEILNQCDITPKKSLEKPETKTE